MKKGTANNRMLQLDGLRGLAVISVVAFHFINNELGVMDAGQLNDFERLLQKATYFGWAGVDLFFVLSGFLIGSILLRNRNSPNFFKTFYIRRFFRIVPIYYVLLVLFFLAKQSPWYASDVYIFLNDLPLIYYFGLVQNMGMSYFGHFGPEALTPTWSLAVEEQFYLIIPVVVYFLKPHQLKYFIAACLLLAPVCRYFSTNWYMKYTLLPSRIDSPIVGFLIAWAMQSDHFVTIIRNNKVGIWIISLIVLLVSTVIYVVTDTGIFNHTLLAIMFGLLLIITLNETSGLYYDFLTSKSLIFIGGISYFVYLFHQMINGLLHLLILNHKIPSLDNSLTMGVTTLAFVVTLTSGYFSQKYFEQPLIKHSHKYVY